MHTTIPTYLCGQFQDFLTQTFATLNPSQQLLSNWHLQLLEAHLQQIEEGAVTRLIINMPPRSLKSTCISVAWPAWLLGWNPAARIIVASYSHALALKHSLDTRAIVTSDWYRAMFPHTIIKGLNTQRKFATTQHGFRYATSVGGSLIGEGADYIIMDDPQTPMQANNIAGQRRVNDWYDQVLSPRLNHRSCGGIILVMQRLGQHDLTNHLLKKGIFQHLAIPIVSENDRHYVAGSYRYTMPAGSLLCPQRIDHQQIEQLKQELGSFAYSAQYLQEPIPLDSVLFRLSWVKRYEQAPINGVIVQSWDCAIKAGLSSDYSVCTTWCIQDNNYYLLDVFRQKMTYVDLRHSVMLWAERFAVNAVLIEDKASGQQLLQELSSILKQPLIPISPKHDKVTRALAISPIFEAGRVYLPKQQSWLASYESELFAFPHGEYDDQVDSTSQFLLWSRTNDHCLKIRVL